MLVHSRYEAREILGRGAQGVVVRVLDREAPHAALVAKVWTAGKFDRGTLASEFALLSRCRIRGLARAWDFGFDEVTSAPFFVEDFVDGASLDSAIATVDASKRDRLVATALADVLETLAALHEAGFVHGDLKPAHVRIDRDGHAVLLDLGAAVARGARAHGYTEGFQPPELIGGASTSARSDLWSLGATFLAALTGAAPTGKPSRLAAPFLRASVADLLDRLVAQHPSDRPESAREALSALGKSVGPDALRGARPSPVGRTKDLARLLAEGPEVRWLVGPSGVGKSFLADELAIEALRAGSTVRVFRFPDGGDRKLAPLLSYLRGTDAAWPFSAAPSASTWLVFDELDAAPREVVQAIEAYRCRRGGAVRVLAVGREAPSGAPAQTLEPLDRGDFSTLCAALHVEDVDAAWQASGGMPAWVAATAGRVPLTAEIAIARTRSLAPRAVRALAQIALLGGALRDPVRERCGITTPELSVLLEQGLLSRHDADHVLTQRALAYDLARALGSCAIVDEIAESLLAGPIATSAELTRLAAAPYPASRRNELLTAAANAARDEGLPIVETAAWLELLVDPRERTPQRLLRLERLTRDTANADAQDRVFQWLASAAADGGEELSCIFLRRSAERDARKGAHDEARDFAERALAIAPDAVARALALATRGTVALFSAQWEQALTDYVEARAALRGLTAVDGEELARLDHNLGVVALYKDETARAEQSFARSLVQKRALGDMAGVRSVLLNLGIARTRAGSYAAAARDLDEAIRLARSLGQRGGLAWCLVARADLALRAGDIDDADAHRSEAAALADAMTPPVRADLAIVAAKIAVARGRGRDALEAIAAIDGALRSSDALVDARAHAARAEALLAILPADRAAAGRAAIAAIRRAREGKLGEIEAAARETLRRARDRRTVHVVKGEPSTPSDIEPMILACAAERDGESAITALLREVLRVTRAERAFAIVGDARTRVLGVDLDGLAIADADQRVPVAAGPIAVGVRYTREAETRGGRGSHVVARPDVPEATTLVLEHRFSPSHFDDVAEARVLAWAALLTIVARGIADVPVAGRASSSSAAHVSSVPASTAMPFVEPRRAFPGILGLSVALKRALARLDSAIDSDLPVLILGETGVGKELFARALHDLGARARGPFVAVNCAAIPDTLFEAELFGHARGSFTGADRERRGLIARAEGGTLFLDEIGELAPMRQATLLRALETRRYRPVGSDDERPFDVRIVSATNRDLNAEVERGAFRRDLLYRLCVLEVRVPALRERREDVPLLLRHHLPNVEIASAAMDALCNYSWPGNVRELTHQAQRLLALRSPRIELGHLPREIRGARGRTSEAPRPLIAEPPNATDPKEEVRLALEATGGNISRAAERLGLTRHGLKKRMLRLGLRSKAT